MIIEHRTRDKHQNAYSLSKKTEFYMRQEQREADRPEIKDGFSFMDKEMYDSLPLARWLDKSGKPIEDHPELPKERPEKTVLKRTQGMPMEIMLKSKVVSAANKGALRVLGRTPIIAPNLGERNLWMIFLVVENLDESDQFILSRDFIRNFDVTIDLNNAMFRIRNPERKYVIKPTNLIMTNENKAPVFLSRSKRSGNCKLADEKLQ